MNFKEGRDCAYFLIFVFSTHWRVPITEEKISLKQFHILVVYSRYLVCASWIFPVGLSRSTCYASLSSYHVELTPWTLSQGSLLPVSFSQQVSLARDWRRAIFIHSPFLKGHQSLPKSLPMTRASVRGGNASIRASALLSQSQWPFPSGTS